jgi:hypothetical protein
MLFELLEDRRLMTADLGGNSLAAATDLGTLQSSRVISDFVGLADVNDYFRLRLGAESELRLGLDGLRADADLQLLDASGRTIASSTRGGSSAESITRTLAAGTYVVRVYRYSGDTNYRLTLSAAPLQSVVPDNAGNSLAAARNLGVLSGERSYSDFVGNSDRDDFYRFDLTGRTVFDLSLTGLSADADVQLLDSAGRAIASSTRGGNQSEAISRTLDAGTYFVRVYQYSGDTNYALTLRARADGPPDGAGNTLAQARNIGTLTGTVAFNDFVGQADTADYYRFRIDTRSNFQLRLDNMTADADVVLLDAAGREIVGSYRGGSSAEAIDRVLESGDYFVQVYPYGAANTNYRLLLTGTVSRTDGWASQTGFRAAETAVQQAIVQGAVSQVGQASPPSRLAHSGGNWYTDVAENDGARIRAAFTAYHGWRWNRPFGAPPSTVTNDMHKALSTTYENTTHRTAREPHHRRLRGSRESRAAGLAAKRPAGLGLFGNPPAVRGMGERLGGHAGGRRLPGAREHADHRPDANPSGDGVVHRFPLYGDHRRVLERCGGTGSNARGGKQLGQYLVQSVRAASVGTHDQQPRNRRIRADRQHVSGHQLRVIAALIFGRLRTRELSPRYRFPPGP